MRFLFVHQNLPGQFRHIARALADDPAHQVVAVGDGSNAQAGVCLHPRITTLYYKSPKGAGQQTHPYLRSSEAHVRRGQQMARAAMQLKARGFMPDVIVVHAGWGEGLFLGEIFPGVRQVHYCEYFYHADGSDLGFDPEFPCTVDDRFRVGIMNSTHFLSLAQCDDAVSPTHWQRSLFPAEYRSKINVLHEGIDTVLVKPDPDAALEHRGQVFRAGQELVTMVARNLEPYRGFHRFMRALPELQARRPHAQVLIVGGDGVSYGRPLAQGASYREKYCAEIDGKVDWSRIHFLGSLPYRDYLKVLQLSAAHVYLTYPFVLSWSVLEAMASGCLVIGSATAPVQEVIEDGDNGLLVDFFDQAMLVQKIADALADPAAYAPLRQRARAFIEQHYDLRSLALPAWRDFLTRARSTPA